MTALNILEEALNKGGDDLDSKRAILDAMLRSRVTVLLDRPWDGRSLPSADTQMLFVTDGENLERAMLAIFTSESRAAEFVPTAGVYKYPVNVDAVWALLGVPTDAGIILNPNQLPNFRINVEVVGILREEAQKQLDQRIGQASLRNNKQQGNPG